MLPFPVCRLIEGPIAISTSISPPAKTDKVPEVVLTSALTPTSFPAEIVVLTVPQLKAASINILLVGRKLTVPVPVVTRLIGEVLSMLTAELNVISPLFVVRVTAPAEKKIEPVPVVQTRSPAPVFVMLDWIVRFRVASNVKVKSEAQEIALETVKSPGCPSAEAVETVTLQLAKFVVRAVTLSTLLVPTHVYADSPIEQVDKLPPEVAAPLIVKLVGSRSSVPVRPLGANALTRPLALR